jgi:hypothetical protein
MKFKKGDKIKIRRDSAFSRQNEGEGTITKVNPDDINKFYYHVKFDDGYINDYTDDDLELTRIDDWEKEVS